MEPEISINYTRLDYTEVQNIYTKIMFYNKDVSKLLQMTGMMKG